MASIEIQLDGSERVAVIEAQKPQDLAEVERLLDQAFGPDRHHKTAYRLRDEVPPLESLSFVARLSGRLVGTLRFWPVLIKKKPGNKSGLPALLLGPIAVEPALNGKGIGIGLMKHGLDRARALGHHIVILVGDPDYYRRVGFTQVPHGRLSMPGPYDAHRLMWLELTPGALEKASGAISPALTGRTALK